jgi:hypothetical protein
MKAEWVRAERDSEVRQAASSWKDAGAVDGAALSAIKALYPATWRTPTALWGILLLFFVSLFVVGLLVALGSASHIRMTAFLLAGGLAFAADRLRGSSSTVGAASSGAAAFWSVVCLLIGIGDAVRWRGSGWTPLLLAGAAAWSAAAWRWGYPAFALLAAVSLFLLLARFPPGRTLWLVLGTVLAAASASLLDRRALAPSHRRGAASVLAASLAAGYAAVNLYALDHRLVERGSAAGWNSQAAPGGPLRALASVATAAFPLIVLAWGIRRRRTLLVDAGIVSAALSLATLRFYVHIAPLWVILTIAGSGLILIALAIHRWLAASPGRERAGFTADALFEDRAKPQALGAIGAVALTPEARSVSPEPGRFSGGGGGYGGGGSSGTF